MSCSRNKLDNSRERSRLDNSIQPTTTIIDQVGASPTVLKVKSLKWRSKYVKNTMWREEDTVWESCLAERKRAREWSHRDDTDLSARLHYDTIRGLSFIRPLSYLYYYCTDIKINVQLRSNIYLNYRYVKKYILTQFLSELCPKYQLTVTTV